MITKIYQLAPVLFPESPAQIWDGLVRGPMATDRTPSRLASELEYQYLSTAPPIAIRTVISHLRVMWSLQK